MDGWEGFRFFVILLRRQVAVHGGGKTPPTKLVMCLKILNLAYHANLVYIEITLSLIIAILFLCLSDRKLIIQR